MMNCELARVLLPFAGKRGDLSPEDAAALEAHIAGCASCAGVAQAAQRFDGQLARAMQSVTLPSGLPERIGSSLAAERSRAFRKKFAGYSAAASVLIVIGLAAGWWSTRRHTLDPQRIAWIEDMRQQQYVSVPSHENAELFFHDQGLRVKLPTDLDYSTVASLDIVVIDGEKVAQISLQRGEFRAKLQVYSRSRFRLPKNAGLEAEASQCKVQMQESEEFVYVFVFYGDSRRHHFQNPANVIG